MARVMSSVRPSCLPTPRFSTGQSRPCPTSTAAFRPSICPTSRSAAAGSITPRRRPLFRVGDFVPLFRFAAAARGSVKSAVPGSRHCPRPSAVRRRAYLPVPRGAGRTLLPCLRQFHRPQLPGRGETRLCAALRDGAGMSLPPSRPARGATCTSKASSRMP